MNLSRIAFVLSVCASAAGAAPAFADTASGPPTIATDNAAIGSHAWSGPLPSSVSLVEGASTATSHYLVLTGFGFSVPSNAVIEGIEASITRSASLTFADDVHDEKVVIVRGGSLGTDDHATFTGWLGGPFVTTFGDPSDLWGEEWTPALVNAANFGVAIAATAENSAPLTSATATVHAVTITITYSFPCPLTLDTTGCDTSAETALLKIDQHAVGSEKLQATISKGAALTQGEMGDYGSPGGPLAMLCIYNASGAFVEQLLVDRAAATCGSNLCWKSLGGDYPAGKAFLYKDASASSMGVTQIKLTGGETGKTKVMVKASGGTAQLPFGIADTLAGQAAATVQFRSEGPDLCLSATLMNVSKNSGGVFAAKK